MMAEEPLALKADPLVLNAEPILRVNSSSSSSVEAEDGVMIGGRLTLFLVRKFS